MCCLALLNSESRDLGNSLLSHYSGVRPGESRCLSNKKGCFSPTEQQARNGKSLLACNVNTLIIRGHPHALSSSPSNVSLSISWCLHSVWSSSRNEYILLKLNRGKQSPGAWWDINTGADVFARCKEKPIRGEKNTFMSVGCQFSKSVRKQRRRRNGTIAVKASLVALAC